MSDLPFPFLPGTPALCSAKQARDSARLYEGLALHMREIGAIGDARLLERRSQWWLTYAIALSQVPPGATDAEGRA